MNRISASKKMLQGRLTPVTVWGGRVLGVFCIIAGVAAVVLGLMSGRLDVANFLPFAGALLVFQWRRTFSGVAGEVLDAGDALLIRDSGRPERVPLSRVQRVEFEWKTLSGTSREVLPVIRLVFQGTRKQSSEIQFVARTPTAISAREQEESAEAMVSDLRKRIAGATS